MKRIDCDIECSRNFWTNVKKNCSVLVFFYNIFQLYMFFFRSVKMCDLTSKTNLNYSVIYLPTRSVAGRQSKNSKIHNILFTFKKIVTVILVVKVLTD